LNIQSQIFSFLYNILLIPFYLTQIILKNVSKDLKEFLEIREKEKKSFYPFTTKVEAIWLHASSVGELDQCKALAKEIKSKNKNQYILQTVFSKSVKPNQYDLLNTNETIHLPLDFYSNYDWIFKVFKPKTIVLMAWDTWPNLIYKAKREKVPVYLCSANWDEKSKRQNLLLKIFTRNLFQNLSGIGTVNNESSESFKKFLNDKIQIKVTGDSRFDSVVDKIVSQKKNQNVNLELLKQNKILILASTYKECDDILLPLLKDIIEEKYFVWIFPHKIDQERILSIESKLIDLGITYSKYSNLDWKKLKPEKVILFDKLGILAHAYKYAKIAYIGGAMHNKIHNVLEPAYFGLGLISGPRFQNSNDAIQFQKYSGLKVIQNSKDFFNSMKSFENKDFYRYIKNTNSNYVISGKGSSARFVKEFLNQFL
jgi:3-deoxy-D-manno-octulosonic-acid transferase